MSFSNYAEQAPQRKTVKYTFRGLRNPDGSHPAAHVEHLGESNEPFWIDEIARAQERAALGLTTTSSNPADVARSNRDDRIVNRERAIKYSVRHLENVFHADGTPATDEDIPLFMRSIPDADFELFWAFASSTTPFRDYKLAAAPKTIAEK